GFPWWPKARLERGGAIIERYQQLSTESTQLPEGMLARVVEDILPTDATVEIEPLQAGHSGSAVFRLRVSDNGSIAEVPRVLKIGEAKMIANELKRYYRYVHNKKVGGASRVDVARGFWWHGRGKEHQSEQSKEYGAIVYTFVGAGAKAI